MSAEKNYSPFSGYQQRPQQHHSAQEHGGGGGGYNAQPNGGFQSRHQPQQQQQQQFGGKFAIGGKLQAVDWANAKLVPGQWTVFDAKAVGAAAALKKQHSDAVRVALPTAEEAEAWREANDITVYSETCPPPMPSFEMLTMLPMFIQRKFAAEGFKAPTPIQAQAWPILFGHRDIVGIAKTGSGKTLAFIVPAIAHIANQEPLRFGDGPICVVLAPTRELAQQIEAETRKVLPETIRCTCVYGGSPKGPQLQQMREGVHILVATPGRLIDFLEIKRVSLMRTTYIVLDEADRMLDMGFEPQVRAICGQIRPDRQTLMFSATWPKEIQKLAAAFQRDFIRIHVGRDELVANPDVAQRFVLTHDSEKFAELVKIMAANRNRRVLVFCKTKKTADQLEFQLKRNGYDAMAIHGDKEQRQREFILERFRRDSRLCVVATDVAARGLDIKQLEVVVNYDFPMQIDDYVHRIGRTGRAGAKGESITFMTRRDDQVTHQVINTLVGIIAGAQQEVPEWMTAWAQEQSYRVMKRRPGFSAHDRAGPALRYSHSNRPSFEPATGGAASATSAAAPKQFFGLAPKGGASAAAAAPAFKQERQYMRFDSDDEDQGAKRARKE